MNKIFGKKKAEIIFLLKRVSNLSLSNGTLMSKVEYQQKSFQESTKREQKRFNEIVKLLKDDCLKYKEEWKILMNRSKEVIKRILAKMPDDFLNDKKWGLQKWKKWAVEPFTAQDYTKYTPDIEGDELNTLKTVHKIIEGGSKFEKEGE